jgi:hypothetical protein
VFRCDEPCRTPRAASTPAATTAYANCASATAHLVPRGPAPPSQGLAGGALDASPVPSHSAQAHRMTAGALKANVLAVIGQRQ